MWLINTETLQLEFFSGATAVDYAILSHTWGDGEVTFGDMSHKSVAQKKAGWPKIEMTCRLARMASPPLAYAWVDTCCIDKTSSTELSEAINSMFGWYRASSLCLVYLADFQIRPGEDADSDPEVQARLGRCRWFSRGWTLQELIAPGRLHFCHSSWEVFGTKESLWNVLRQITGIDATVLKDASCLDAVPVGRRLSWAAQRRTTRIEDVAYSLLGIFDVNMPLLYGEGPKAFVRLQEEIARSTNDLSLFAWQQSAAEGFRFRGIFAHSPREFLRCRYLKSPLERNQLRTDFGLTNRGLRIADNLMPHELRELDRTNDGLLLGLDCIESSPETLFAPRWVGIYLWKHGSTYVRWSPGDLHYEQSRRGWESHGATPKYVATVLSQQEIQSMHVQTKILIVSNRSSTKFSEGIVERSINTRGSFVSYHIFPIHTGSKLKTAKPTNVAVLYGIQGDLSTKPENREPWAMLYVQGQSPKAVSNHVDDIFKSEHDSELAKGSSIAQDFVFANYSDVEGVLQDDKMPKQVNMPDLADPSMVHRVSVDVYQEPTVLRFGLASFNRCFRVMVRHTVVPQGDS